MPALLKLIDQTKNLSSLDAFDWQAAIAFEIYGVRLGVRVNHAEAIERIKTEIPIGAKIIEETEVDRLSSLILADTDDSESALYIDDELDGTAFERDWFFRSMDGFFRLAMAELTPDYVILHAGVVSWKNKAIVIPARSGSGKTTLVSELIKAGAVCYSDECAIIDKNGLVHPYPRPLNIRRDKFDYSSRYSAEELGAAIGTAPVPIGMVVLSKYLPDSNWRPRKLSGGRGVIEIMKHTGTLARNPQNVISYLSKAIENAIVLTGKRGDAAQTARAILKKLELSNI